MDCDASGANCTAIAGATNPNYILGSADVGHTVLVQETAYNSGGTGPAVDSSPTAVVAASAAMSTTGAMTFAGNFENGITPWKTGGGGAQCANYGTPSNSPRLRGNFNLVSNPAGQGLTAGEITLPADTNPSTYPLEACDLVTASQPMVLPTDQYYGLMVYVPAGWTIPARSASASWWGVEIAQLHFGSIYSAPIALQLHPDHITINYEAGGCNPYGSSAPGCRYRSNADAPSCMNSTTVTCLPKDYAIPPGAFVQGKWNELIMHVHWAPDSTGEFQTWYRTMGSTAWTESSSLNGYPTLQWSNTGTCCMTSYVDLTEAYTPALTAPLSVWMDNDVVGSGFGSVAASMP
jgi:hypothetical protein